MEGWLKAAFPAGLRHDRRPKQNFGRFTGLEIWLRGS